MPFFILLVASILSSVHLCLQSTLVESLVKEKLVWNFGDSTLQFCSKYRLEGFYGKNTRFLNDDNEGLDQSIIPARHTFDLGGFYEYGRGKYDYSLVTIKAVVRNKGIWGDPELIAPTDRSTVGVAGIQAGDHYHALNKHLLWVRELWIESNLNDMLGLSFYNSHTFTAGFFPFELGRGIALGDAYAMDPDFLGFYSPNAVDQYAPGLKFSGLLDYDGNVSYDLYVEIISNRSDNFTNINKKIRAQEYGHQFTPARGFGKINWLCAGRLQWHFRKNDSCDLMLEPYVLFVDQREQRLEFLGDAESKLGTVGFAFELNASDVQLGFEFAQNLGRQRVFGWDRNESQLVLRDGSVVAVNSQVTAINSVSPDTAGQNALVTKANQAIITTSPRSQQLNGQQIDTSNLKNSTTRFRDPYTNTFTGYMAVWDIMYSGFSGVKLAATAGVATGGENPNKDMRQCNDSNEDSEYEGFVSLQEQYAGKLVRSAFLMSGSGKIPRILSFPAQGLYDPFPEQTSQFTNLLFTGVALYTDVGKWSLNPNVISYWQEHPSHLAAVAPQRTADGYASTWLGIEFNLFADVYLDNSIKLYSVSSVFLPGMHYFDLKGIPLNKDQKKFLDSATTTGPTTERVPVLGTNAAFTVNIGIEYKF